MPIVEPTESGSTPILRKIGVWILFLALFYMVRNFFFMAFATFVISYLALNAVQFGMDRLSRGREKAWLRRLLTVGVFLFVPLVLAGLGWLLAPRILEQGKKLSGWLGQIDPETEAARLCERYVGPSEFKRVYPSDATAEYSKDLEDFRKSGMRHLREYQDFPQLESWVEGGFRKQYTAEAAGRTRSRLLKEGTNSADFRNWFANEKAPELRAIAGSAGQAKQAVSRLQKSASTLKDDQLLEVAKESVSEMDALRSEWIQWTIDSETPAMRATSEYQNGLRRHYEAERTKKPGLYIYTFDQYLALQKARPLGKEAFGDAVEEFRKTAEADKETQLKADFQAYKEHELFRDWWGTSSVAKFVRHHMESAGGQDGSERVERMLASLLNIPLDLCTAVLLSLFICIDFPKLRDGVRGLRETWLREGYETLAPAFANLGILVGRAMFAQGIIAFCNALMILIALTFLGVEHEFLLAGVTFVLCMIPTLGSAIAWAIITLFALVQPDGGMMLALKASGAFLFVMCMEMFVLSPRILGKMMEIHPVLSITILPVAQFFFGVWGLILAIPVVVYIIYVVIYRGELPGMKETPASTKE